jgi:UrcA family protein
MLNMKSVASALVVVASAADFAVPVLVAPALVFAVSTAARAEEPTVRHEVVRYGDLNIASPVGMAAFKARVNGAAKTVCGPTPDAQAMDETADYKACVSKAIRDAVSALPQARQTASQSAHAG